MRGLPQPRSPAAVQSIRTLLPLLQVFTDMKILCIGQRGKKQVGVDQNYQSIQRMVCVISAVLELLSLCQSTSKTYMPRQISPYIPLLPNLGVL
jgi:hypothetical protein